MSTIPIVIAHRGACGYRPEHTRSAYLLAIAMGADAIEPDLVATSDGILVIRHENEISGTTDVASHPEFADRRITKTVDGQELSGWFTEDFTWAELSTLRAVERIPKVRKANRAWDGRDGILRLVDLLQILDDSTRRVAMVAEVKHATYFASIGLPLDELYAAELATAGWSDDARLTTECFELSLLLRVRERGVGGKFVFLIDSKGSPPDEVAEHGATALEYSEYLTSKGLAALATEVDGISLAKRLVLPKAADTKTVGASPLVSAAHAAGLSVFVWTLRAENKFLGKGLTKGVDAAALGLWKQEFTAIMRSGVDGVFADQPDLAIQARASLIS
ncbi:MAG: glycerophosphodiester phosphodiesterase [Microbacteriaceae bacterium]|nr:glycerophosphodiester phosphodiesterase [Microbacteriaceae bacterium]